MTRERTSHRVTKVSHKKQAANTQTGAACPPRAKRGRNVGKLTLLLSMPIDVFFEIASHLDPVDVLRLSRVSVAFRKMLLSRTSRHIWIASRKNVYPPLPDCPDDLSEPLYAALLFERVCMRCGEDKSMKVDFTIRLRFCDRCWAFKMRTGIQLLHDLGPHFDSDFRSVALRLLPAVSYDMCKDGLFSVELYGNLQMVASQNGQMYFLKEEFELIAEQYRKVCTGESPGSLKQFLIRHRVETANRLMFQRRVLQWISRSREMAREDQLLAKRERRLAIESKLRELGFEPEDYPTRDASFNRLLNQPRNLTPRIWNNIRPKLLKLLHDEQARREATAFNAKWYQRREELRMHYTYLLTSRHSLDIDEWMRIMPGFEEMVEKPSMATLLTSASPEEHVTEEQFALIKPAILEEAEEMIAEVRRQLVKLLRENENATKSRGNDKSEEHAEDILAGTGDDPVSDITLLEQPSSLFKCIYKRCNADNYHTSMTFLGVLEHQVAAMHADKTFITLHIEVASLARRELMLRLLDALSMPRDSTLTNIRERIMSGMPTCSCGPGLPLGSFTRAESTLQQLVLTASSVHQLSHVEQTTTFDLTTMSVIPAVHHITVGPHPGVQPGPGELWGVPGGLIPPVMFPGGPFPYPGPSAPVLQILNAAQMALGHPPFMF